MDKQPISREGYEKLREEIRRLDDDEMPKIAAQIAAARAEGDLSENAEYHGQREAQGAAAARWRGDWLPAAVISPCSAARHRRAIRCRC